MGAKGLMPINLSRWVCQSCRQQSSQSLRSQPARLLLQSRKSISSTAWRQAEVQEDRRVRAAPEIDFGDEEDSKDDIAKQPARIIPVSGAYFTTSPVLIDHVLRLERFIEDFGALPIVRPEDAPRVSWMSLAQFRSFAGEEVGSSKYSQIVRLLRRLNLIHPKYRPPKVEEYLAFFRRPGSVPPEPAKPTFIDEFGVSTAKGRRKSSTAKVQLVEGSGEVLINGKSIVETFPRIHDRESALWPLKVTERIDKYNAFVLTAGGGLTGQAESVTLAMAKALLVHEPALKPTLRRGESLTA